MKLLKIIEVEITVEDIVKILTNSGDQAEFFNLLAKEFKTFSNGDRDGMQMLFIKDELNEDGINFIKKLYEYICLPPER